MCYVTHSCVWQDSFMCADGWHDSFLCVTYLIRVCAGLIHMCDMSHSHLGHDSCICVRWRMCMHVCVWHDYVYCVTSSFHMCDVNDSYEYAVCRMIHMCDVNDLYVYEYVWHDYVYCVTWIIHMCDVNDWYVYEVCRMIYVSMGCAMTYVSMGCAMTYLHVWREGLLCVTWLIHMCDVRVTNVAHDDTNMGHGAFTWVHPFTSYKYGTRRIYIFACIYLICHKSIAHQTWFCYMNVSYHTYACEFSVALMNEACHAYSWIISHLCMRVECFTHERGVSHVWTRRVTRMNESCRAYL